MLEKTNLLGAVVAIAFFVSAILVFSFRLLGKPQVGHWIGYFEFLLAAPLIFLLVKAPQLERPALYSIQIGCMLAWLVVEALLDLCLKSTSEIFAGWSSAMSFYSLQVQVDYSVWLPMPGTGGVLQRYSCS